ncbi:MAG: hypothetical protein K8W52_25090 [Deltaproteobacteria bacterium]|nr:hypothetical protein [Deltaproteobacteria bacterium]
MDDEVLAARALWQLRLEAGAARRGLHARQCAAAEAMLAATATVTTVAELEAALAARGLTGAMAGAECLDRYHNRAIVYGALDDRARRAALAPLEALRGPPVDAPLDGILRAQLAVEGQLQAAAIARPAFLRAVALTLDWHSEPSIGMREVQRLMIAQSWQLARTFDRTLTWAALPAPYRDRLPFDDRGVAAIGAWLIAALGDPGMGLELPAFPAPEVIDPHELQEPIPYADARHDDGDRARAELAQLTAQGPSSAAAQLAGERHELLSAIARTSILAATAPRRARAVAWAQPHIAALGACLDDDLAWARTPTELELAGMWHHERLAIEADALGLLAQVALRPLALAISSDDHGPDELAPSLGDAAALCGAPWLALIESPWLADLTRVLIATGGDPQAPLPGPEVGEVGVEYAAALRSAVNEPGSRFARMLATTRPLTTAAFMATCRAIAAAAPPVTPGALRLLGKDLALDDLAPALAASRERLAARIAVLESR